MYNVPVVEFEVSQTHVRHGRVGYSLHKACVTFVHAKSCGCMKIDVYTWNTLITDWSLTPIIIPYIQIEHVNSVCLKAIR